MPPEEPEKELTFHDITSAADFQPGYEVPWTLIILAGTVLMVIVLIVLVVVSALRLKKGDTINLTGTPVSDALQSLQALRKSSSEKTVQQAATELSQLLRETLTRITGTPALYQSQQEFHQTDFTLNDPALTHSIQEHLNTLWSLEYSAPQANPQIVQNQLSATEELLQKLRHHHR